ncbi:MAG: GvpL/GvpF family gas vesicle protein [Bacteroidetes bacterium]|nr:GvpL/GvpF family gas vesicle protein [Bacteroidota bacterium]
MINELIYVFCVTNTAPDFVRIMESQGLKSLIFDDFCVIVKYVSENEYSEENLKKNLSDIKWLEAGAREHIMIINMIMEYSTVVPFKFGTIFQSEDNLKKFITDYSDSLIKNLVHVEGKEEWAVKYFYDRKALCAQIDEISDEAAAMEKQIMSSSPGKAFLLKRKKNDLIENEIDRLCKLYGQECYNEFNNLSKSTNLNNVVPKEFTGRNDEMILNATFLVSKEKAIDFLTTGSVLKRKYSNLGFDIEITGPWPPFSFISIKEKQ